jgi:hypothetical protein
MKNHYTISPDGLIATIQLKRRNGEILHCLVDSADLPKLQGFNVTWHASWHNDIQDFYVEGNVRDDGEKSKRRLVRMHRFLTDAPRGLEVDHWNHITTDNRRSNLRVVTHSVNQMNRKGATCKSKSGHRGIFLNRKHGKFYLTVTINGERKTIGYFDTVEEALTARDSFPEYARKRGS